MVAAIWLGLLGGLFVPASAFAQNSILPEKDIQAQGIPAITTCDELRNALEANPAAVEGKVLALKVRCGRMVLGDLPHYFKHALSFVLNIIGTLAVIAVIRAGYIFMLSKDKEYGDGRKAVLQVFIGLFIAALSFTAAQIVLRLLFAIETTTPLI